MSTRDFDHLIQQLGLLSSDQLESLRQELDSKLAISADVNAAALTQAQLTHLELQRKLHEAGLLSEVRPPVRVNTGTEALAPIPIQGEPLSVTVSRDRR